MYDRERSDRDLEFQARLNEALAGVIHALADRAPDRPWWTFTAPHAAGLGLSHWQPAVDGVGRLAEWPCEPPNQDLGHWGLLLQGRDHVEPGLLALVGWPPEWALVAFLGNGRVRAAVALLEAAAVDFRVWRQQAATAAQR